MNKLLIAALALLISAGCTNQNRNSGNGHQEISAETAGIIDSLLYYKHHYQETDLLSRKFPELTRDQAIAIQLAMLKKELDAGARQVGWKMGGTVAADQSGFDPMFGYMLDSHVIAEDSLVSIQNFPGGKTMVEGEIGFVISKDFKGGAGSVEELKEGIEYVINAVEFAQDIAIPTGGNPESKTINHTVAAGMGHAGLMLGSGRADVQEFQIEEEAARCYVDDRLAAEGVASNIYGGPLNALYALVNILPEYGTYLKKGDIVVTGSVYENPTVDSAADVRLEFSSLGDIHFQMK